MANRLAAGNSLYALLVMRIYGPVVQTGLSIFWLN